MKNSHPEVYEEIRCVASNRSRPNRRVDIFAVHGCKKLGYILDSILRFETYVEQPLDIHMEKKKTNLWTYFWLLARRAGSDGSMSASGSAGPGFDPGGVVNFNLKIFNLGARLYITVLD